MKGKRMSGGREEKRCRVKKKSHVLYTNNQTHLARLNLGLNGCHVNRLPDCRQICQLINMRRIRHCRAEIASFPR